MDIYLFIYYFPPNANPPSKQPMLTLLKQARSFGVGIILSTQNPVDIDYKGLANIGTWFIGRLQTKQDKEKVIDGLSSAVEGKIDKNEMENLLSNLEKRTFIMKNINEDGIKIFQTRWTLSYLKGPITKEQIKFLMSNKNINSVSKTELPKTKVETTNRQNSAKPLIPNILEQKYLYTSQSESYYLQGYLLCKCSVHFNDTSKNIDQTNELNYRFYLQKEASNVNFEELEEFKENSFETNERVNSNYYETPIFIQNEKELKQIQKDFTDFIYRTTKLSLFKNEDLKIISKQNESLTDFKIRIQDRLNEKVYEQIESLQEKFSKTNDSIDDKLNKLFDKLEKEQLQANTTTTDAIISIGTSLLGAFFGKSTTASTLGKVASSARGATKILKEKSDVKYVESEIQQLQIEKEELQKTLENEISKINVENKISNFQIEEIFIKPKRTDVIPNLFFYLASFFAFILTMNLAFNGRYENFEIYGFIILAISFLWLLKNQYNKLNFGKFEKVLSVVLVIASITVAYNETFLNIFSNIWIILALIFAYILNKGTTKDVSLCDLKELSIYILAFVAIFTAFKFGFTANKALAIECNLDSSSLACGIKDFIGASIYFGYIGIVAIISAIIAFIIDKKSYTIIALFFSVGSLILSNTFLGSLGFMIAVYLLTKEDN